MFFAELLSALGFAPKASLPAWWHGAPARAHVRRWIDDLGLSEDRIIEVATQTRRDHPNPPDGPKALDRFIERAAQRDAQAAANAGKAKRSRKAQRVLTRGKWRKVEVLACPVTWRPHPEQIASARRGYEDWWQALDWVRDGLVIGGMMRDFEMMEAMPRARPWLR